MNVLIYQTAILILITISLFLFYRLKKVNGADHNEKKSVSSYDPGTISFEDIKVAMDENPVKGDTIKREDYVQWHDTIFRKNKALVEKHRHFSLGMIKSYHDSNVVSEEPVLLWLFVHVKMIDMQSDGRVRFFIEDPYFSLWTEPFRMKGASAEEIYAHRGRMVKLHAECDRRIKVRRVERTIFKLDGTTA